MSNDNRNKSTSSHVFRQYAWVKKKAEPIDSALLNQRIVEI